MMIKVLLDDPESWPEVGVRVRGYPPPEDA